MQDTRLSKIIYIHTSTGKQANALEEDKEQGRLLHRKKNLKSTGLKLEGKKTEGERKTFKELEHNREQ